MRIVVESIKPACPIMHAICRIMYKEQTVRFILERERTGERGKEREATFGTVRLIDNRDRPSRLADSSERGDKNDSHLPSHDVACRFARVIPLIKGAT